MWYIFEKPWVIKIMIPAVKYNVSTSNSGVDWVYFSNLCMASNLSLWQSCKEDDIVKKQRVLLRLYTSSSRYQQDLRGVRRTHCCAKLLLQVPCLRTENIAGI